MAIKSFLAGREELAEPFREFLATASVEEFISRVVQPFQWVTNQPGTDG
ncbi:hypothetical protein J2Y48_002757 [Mycoplana sp. BE70]|nr:hypothetical protein [Mycoplana sp. BE70]MDR6757461.1 hypothetical protein [Mycoplana sp. BE70]